MFAVIKTGGKQYKVSRNDVISVEKLIGSPGDQIEINDVLLLGEEGKTPTIGSPLIAKASVTAEILEQSRGDKVIVFKKKRRHNYRRKRGHRQELTVLRVLEVNRTTTKSKVTPKKSTAKKADSPDKNAQKEKVTEKKPATKKISKMEKATPTKKASAKKPAAKKDPNKKAATPEKKAPGKKPVTKKTSTKAKKSTNASKD